MKTNHIYRGDALKVLKKWPNECVNMCMTSPPYWALRDYGIKGQLGLEPTFEEHISKMCDIFDEVKRVLRKDGTCWVNYGDTYSSSSGGMGKTDKKRPTGGQPKFSKEANKTLDFKQNKQTNLPDKSLTMIPFRFAIEMVNRGWILRNVIIWHKPNCMPQSAKDRFTVDFEYLFFFSKSKKYYFEQQFEKLVEGTEARANRAWYGSKHKGEYAGRKRKERGEDIDRWAPKQGRNKRCVWKIPTQPFPKAHFAVYPEKLCIMPIKAGCPEFICKKCGEAREKVFEINYDVQQPEAIMQQKKRKDFKGNPAGSGFKYAHATKKVRKKGLTDCGCNAGFRKGIVLDPFMGAGTTALVARKLSRDYVGIELSPDYIKIANRRLAQQVLI